MMGPVHEIDLLFCGHPVLARRIDAYRRRTDAVLGARALDGLDQLAQRFRTSGLIGLLVAVSIACVSLAIVGFAPGWRLHGASYLFCSAMIVVFSGSAFRRSWSNALRAGNLARQDSATTPSSQWTSHLRSFSRHFPGSGFGPMARALTTVE